MVKLMHYNASFIVNINAYASVMSGRLFLSYNGPGTGHLCHIDTYLVSVLFFSAPWIRCSWCRNMAASDRI